MQTFLPYDSFYLSAKCLDYKRLGKQRIEANQILAIINNKQKGYNKHPAANMWLGFSDALKLYFNVISTEWVLRGYRHNIGFYEINNIDDIEFPGWFGYPKFHISHQSNLLRKNKTWYSQFFNIRDDIPYFWPQPYTKYCSN